MPAARDACALLRLFVVAQLRAQDTTRLLPSQALANRVAATVDGVEIDAAQVERYVQRMLGKQTVDAEVRNRAQAEALEQLIKQQIVLASLERQGEACSQQQLDLAIARFKEELVRQEKTLEDYCQSGGISVPAFERAMRWQLSWDRYLQKSLTDENLQRYFESHRRDFDGTRMRVAQILLTLTRQPARPSRGTGGGPAAGPDAPRGNRGRNRLLFRRRPQELPIAQCAGRRRVAVDLAA